MLITHCHFDHTGGVAALKQLIGLNADILCQGHFGIFRGKKQAREFIRSFIQ
jgi:glyoxylase-like metal-dependent hydrolase (beta-lactamase superfamily II)